VSYPLPHDDGELIAAAMAYLTIAMMQQVRSDAHLVVRDAPVLNSYFWPAGWNWEPAPTTRENLLKARDLLDAQLAEPGQPVPTHGYPPQHEVAAYHAATSSSLQERTMDLLREVGALRTALLERQENRGSDFAAWTRQARNAFADVFLDLLDLAETAGFDLETITALRWRETNGSTPKDVVPDAPATP